MIDVLDDRYELSDLLGSGGMGEVYRARDRRLDRTVAIKLMRHGPLADDVSRARMRSEATLAASIHHRGVAQVFDHVDDSSDHPGVSYIVMEYIDGHSLAELLRERGPMDPTQVMSIVSQVASGLAAVHGAGVVHRDLKPANIMLTPAGRTVLVDFGIARSESSEPLTDTGTVLGTAQYSSPEQTSGRPATPRSDLYSLGVVAHHCLTGESPFRRETPVATAMAHLTEDLPELDPSVPRHVRDLVTAMTAKDPSERPASADLVTQMAEDLGADETISMPATLRTSPAGPATAPVAAVTAPNPPTAARHPDPATDDERRPRRRMVPVVAAAAVLLLVLGGWAMWPSDDTVVPDVVGLSARQAEKAVEDAGLTPRTRQVDVADGRAGEVVKQSPRSGADRPDDRVVDLSVVSGQVVVDPDRLIGSSYDDVAAALQELGLRVERKNVTQSTDAGDVVALDRTGRVDVGTTVTVSVAVAPVATPAPVVTQTPDSSGKGPADQKDSKGPGKGKDPKKP